MLCEGFMLSNDQVYEFLSENEREMHDFTVKEMVSVVRSSANQSLNRKFGDLFKKAEDGKKREWKEIEEEKIKDIFEKSKAKVETLFNQFKIITFPTGLTKSVDQINESSLLQEESKEANETHFEMSRLIDEANKNGVD